MVSVSFTAGGGEGGWENGQAKMRWDAFRPPSARKRAGGSTIGAKKGIAADSKRPYLKGGRIFTAVENSCAGGETGDERAAWPLFDYLTTI